ncbi:UNVERIFIED_CONTAM: Pectinesterase 3 [Sesamum angustifolium]|uniref:Pectinesterase 3 n=1 Tax=Sesamum angustifolium TaxID=2727405 RepID=A0AAW2IVJ2_9LAMI
MLVRRLPRHSLRPLQPPVLPRMRHNRDDRLHLWQLGSCVPKLQHHAEAASVQPVRHNNCPRKEGPQSEHWDFHPTLHDEPTRRSHCPNISGQAMEGFLGDRYHAEQHWWILGPERLDFMGFQCGPTSSILYAEYQNTGPGASTSNRVTWAGYKPTLTADQASKYNVESFIEGSSWLPATAVTFDST